MNDSITSLPHPRLATRVAARVARWQRPLSRRLEAGDTFARRAGWAITRTRFGGRIYRDPRFGQLSTTRSPGQPLEVARPAAGPPRLPPAPGALPAPGTSPPPPAPARRMEAGGRSR